MQVTPALPWDETVEGGTVALRSPMTLQQLLDGNLLPVISQHQQNVFGEFVVYPSDNMLYISAGGSFAFKVTNVDTRASSAVYSELELERVEGNHDTLVSIQLRTSDLAFTSPLPWSQEGAGVLMGEIFISGNITVSDLINGALDFFVDVSGVSTKATVTQGSSQDKINVSVNNSVVMTGFYEGNILSMQATTGGGPALVQVIKAFDLEGGSLDPDSSTMIGENIKIWTPVRSTAYDEETESSETIGKCIVTIDGIGVVGGTVPSDTVEGEVWSYTTLGLQGALNNASDINWPIRISDLNLADYPGGILNAYIDKIDGNLEIVVAKYNGEDSSPITMPMWDYNIDRVQNWGQLPPVLIGR